MASLFTRIIQGEIPCYKLGENEQCFSFLDIKPLAKGHALVIPKLEVDYIFDAPDELLQEMMLFSKRMAIAIRKIVPCTKIGMSVIGLEVPHAHIHLVPLNQLSDLNFSNPRKEFSAEEYQDLASKISAAFASA
ncbi:MAG TPA: HIT family protein [Saprospiraceae bacterium]|nr:HIT family protein [Saprospiraceae bacterium]